MNQGAGRRLDLLARCPHAVAMRRLLILPLLLIALPACAGEQRWAFEPGECRVTDGDTIRCGDLRFRFAGIDAPEMSTPAGLPSKNHLIELMTDRAIECVSDGHHSYQRIVAICSADGEDLAARMVQDGFAKNMRRFPPDY